MWEEAVTGQDFLEKTFCFVCKIHYSVSTIVWKCKPTNSAITVHYHECAIAQRQYPLGPIYLERIFMPARLNSEASKISSKWRLLAATVTAMAATSSPLVLAQVVATDTLGDGFREPPASARPRVWWHWMNGNVTEEGIKLDLEWMKRIGIGGIQNFDAELKTPQVVKNRLAYMTPAWKHAFRFAAQTADSLGLEMAIAASPGWSESGGPWVAPQDGMKKLVWSETAVADGKIFKGKLPAPPSTTGPFQDMIPGSDLLNKNDDKQPATYYRDTYVMAYRDSGMAIPVPRFTASSAKGDFSLLTDGRFNASITLPASFKTEPSWLRADFSRAQKVSSATLAMPPPWLFGTASHVPALEASEDGVTFREVARFPNKNSPQYSVNFPAVTAKSMRFVFHPVALPFDLPAPPAAGVDFSSMAAMSSGGGNIAINEVSFSNAPRVHRFEEKAAFALADNYYDLAPSDAPGIASTDVIDLTSRMKPDGSLNWMPPKGNWRVLRMGYSLTGKENHPATKEATGLEVDKYDADAVKRYINTYLDTYVDAVGKGLMGAKGVRAILNDSIEVGAANWTTHLAANFKARRGYDMGPWLPALTGVAIQSSAKSDAFLYDFRKTLSELIAESHYGTIASEVRKRGLIHYSEALEAGRPSIGDDMAMRRYADIPMAAMWAYKPGEIGPKPQYWGDIRGAASVAHIYGQNIVAAESLTSALSYWSYAPRDLQPMIDMEFALGVNRPVIHTSVHQPLTDHAPGFSLWIFGQYFSRLETWGEMAKPWIDYISRNSYMLQQGRHVADVAYFYGEEMPITALYSNGVPTDLPRNNGFDYVNADVLINQLSNDGNDVAAKSGARYKVIYLGGSSAKMSLSVLKRLDNLVRNGATVVGHLPSGSPALMDDPAEFGRIANALWNGNSGKGRVIASTDIQAALATLGMAPDFGIVKAAPDATVMFVHRKRSDADIYYFTNRKARSETLQLQFAISGKKPELWDAATGDAQSVAYESDAGQTRVSLVLRPHQSGYVVFRPPVAATKRGPSSATTAVLLSNLSDKWRVGFQPGRGAPATAEFPKLIDLSTSDVPGIKYFSGTTTYKQQFSVATTHISNGKRLYLNLGDVREVAEVLINGKSVAIAWKPPYRVDISKHVRTGKNALEVRVANLWVNRLIGDAQPGAKPMTFTTLKTYTQSAPLRPSGLLGPVTLESGG
jgi:hypothetical protein